MSRRAASEPVFVSRQTAAERLEISVDTFETWLRAGFIPAAHINRGQIVRWHWPSLESRLAETADTVQFDPSVQGVIDAENRKKGRNRVAA
jgi:hypothetical protein